MPGSEEESWGDNVDRLVDFEDQEDGSVLDHLVPADERVEPALKNQGQLPISPEDKWKFLDQMHVGCHTVEQAALTQRQWSQQGCKWLLQKLHQLIAEHTPSAVHYDARNAVMERINNLVRPGLMQYTGMYVAHYGSFTSGLFAPDGDLDIAIEGVLKQRDNVQKNDSHRHLENGHGVDVSDLAKHEKAALLRALCRKITNQQMASGGQIERVLHARVPIIKFVDQNSGIPCDVAIGSGGARFKSTVLRYLAQIDSRFQGLTRLVKRWAKAWHLNDASNGTFNTFALTNMVVFHLQTREPPILPALCDLFDLPKDAIEERPLHLGQPADHGLLEMCAQRAAAWHGRGNLATLLDLLASFFAQFSNAIAVWTNDTSAGQLSRAVRVSTWAGGWSFMVWPKRYLVPVEDPFDATDNCARSVMATRIDHVRDSFRFALQAMMQLQDGADVQHTLSSLFVQQEQPNFRSLGFGDRRDRRFVRGRDANGGRGRDSNGARGRGAKGGRGRDANGGRGKEANGGHERNENGGAGHGRGGGQATTQNRDAERAQGLWRIPKELASNGFDFETEFWNEGRPQPTASAQLRSMPPAHNARQWVPRNGDDAYTYDEVEVGSRVLPRNAAGGGNAIPAGNASTAVAAQRSKGAKQPRAIAKPVAGQASTPIAAVSNATAPPGFAAAAPLAPPGFAQPASASMPPQAPPLQPAKRDKNPQPVPPPLAKRGKKPLAPPPPPSKSGLLPQAPPPPPAKKGGKPIAPPPGWPSGTAGGASLQPQEEQQQQQGQQMDWPSEDYESPPIPHSQADWLGPFRSSTPFSALWVQQQPSGSLPSQEIGKLSGQSDWLSAKDTMTQQSLQQAPLASHPGQITASTRARSHRWPSSSEEPKIDNSQPQWHNSHSILVPFCQPTSSVTQLPGCSKEPQNGPPIDSLWPNWQSQFFGAGQNPAQVVPGASTVTSPGSRWQDQFLRRNSQGVSAATGEVGNLDMKALAAGLPDSLDSPLEQRPQRKPQGVKKAGPLPAYDPFQGLRTVAAVPQMQTEPSNQAFTEGATAGAEAVSGKGPNSKARSGQRRLSQQERKAKMRGASESQSADMKGARSGESRGPDVGVQVEEGELAVVADQPWWEGPAAEGPAAEAAAAVGTEKGTRRNQNRRGRRAGQRNRLLANSASKEGSGDQRPTDITAS